MDLEKHDALLARWSLLPHHEGRAFVRDGVIDAKRWAEAPCRVLFVLKEAYGTPGDTRQWDLRTAIRDEWKGPKWQLWWNVAYWAFGIHAIAQGRRPQMPSAQEQWDESRHALLASAVVNVKKSGGVSQSDPDDIGSWIESDRDLIRQQVALIAPDLAIWGNVHHSIEVIWRTRVW